MWKEPESHSRRAHIIYYLSWELEIRCISHHLTGVLEFGEPKTGGGGTAPNQRIFSLHRIGYRELFSIVLIPVRGATTILHFGKGRGGLQGLQDFLADA